MSLSEFTSFQLAKYPLRIIAYTCSKFNSELKLKSINTLHSVVDDRHIELHLGNAAIESKLTQKTLQPQQECETIKPLKQSHF